MFPERLLPIIKAVPGSEQNIERRYLPNVDVGVALTDKEGVVFFPLIDGRLDYRGFARRHR